MRSATRCGLTAVVLVVAWLTLVGRSEAGPSAFCCVCNLCSGRFSCVNALSPTDCEIGCGGLNDTVCGGQVVDAPCEAVPQCHQVPIGAPTLSAGGLTATALLLAAGGALALRRTVRRKRG